MKYYSVILVSLSFVAVHHPAHTMSYKSNTNSTCSISKVGSFHKSLHEWYDDECHRFRCEVKNGKEVINVTRCLTLQFPDNAIHCRPSNEHNKEERYPKCCPRLKCIVIERGIKYIEERGQPGETFTKISLTSQEVSDAYEDFDYESMSARHRASQTKTEDRDPALAAASMDVLGNRDYTSLFEDQPSARAPAVKLKAGPPQYYVVEEPSPRPNTILEWLLWPIRGLFSSKIEVLGVTRFALNSSFVKNYWDWIFFLRYKTNAFTDHWTHT